MLFRDWEGPSDSAASCCDVVCDRLAPQSGGDPITCVVQRALAGDANDELLELVTAGKPESFWVSAASIDGEPTRVAVYLRPADRVDDEGGRRLAGDQPVAQSAELRIHTFGGLRIQAGGETLGGDWLRQRPGELLEYLVCTRGRLATSEQISEALWPSAAQPWSNARVRHQIHVLRERLEPHRTVQPSRLVVTRRGGYMLDPERIWIDVDRFEDRIRSGLTLFVQGKEEAARTPLEEALDLYRGDFLTEHPYAEWALEERDRLRELAGRGLRAVTSLLFMQGDLEGATEHARRLAGMEPFDMDVQREYLRLCIRRGRQSEAMRRYALIRRRVRREFGHEPDFSLADLGH